MNRSGRGITVSLTSPPCCITASLLHCFTVPARFLSALSFNEVGGVWRYAVKLQGSARVRKYAGPAACCGGQDQ